MPILYVLYPRLTLLDKTTILTPRIRDSFLLRHQKVPCVMVLTRVMVLAHAKVKTRDMVLN